MPKISERTAAERRNRLLDAAERCFADRGLGGTTMQDVIAESGMSAGGIYGYFASKADIVAAVAARRHDRDAALLAGVAEDGDPLQLLREIGRRFAADLATAEGQQTRRVALRLWSEALSNDDIRRSVLGGVTEPAAVIEQLLRRIEGKPVRDPASTARATVALFQGWILQQLWGGAMGADELLAAFDALVAGSRLAVPSK